MKEESVLIDWTGPSTLTLDQKITLINKMGCDVIRFEESKSGDLIWFNGYLPDEIREDVRSILERLMNEDPEAAEQIQNLSINLKQESKIIVWYNTILTYKDGAIIGTLSSGKDISTQVQAERAQFESNKNFRLLVENAKDAILVLQDGEFKYANTTASEICGYAHAELMDRKWIDLIDPEHRETITDCDLACLEKGDISLDLKMITKNGEPKLVELKAVSTTWDDRDAAMIYLEEINTDRNEHRLSANKS